MVGSLTGSTPKRGGLAVKLARSSRKNRSMRMMKRKMMSGMRTILPLESSNPEI